MNYEDIFARLMNGEKADNIAKEMADALNKATARATEEEKRQKELAEAAAADREDRLNTLAAQMADLLNEYIRLSVPDLLAEAEADGTPVPSLTVEEVRTIADETFGALNKMKTIKAKVTKLPKSLKSLDDVFDMFFKDMGIQ